MKRGDSVVTLPVNGPTREDAELATTWETQTRDDAITCETHEDYGLCAEIARDLTAKHKAMCAERDEIIKPINAGVARVRAMYKPVLESLKAAEARIRQAMVDYQQDCAAQRQIAEIAAREAIEHGEHAEMVQHVTAATAPAPTAQGAHVRKTWKIRIVDEQKIPRKFLCVDNAALKRYGIAHGWQNAPDGVEFYQEEGIALR